MEKKVRPEWMTEVMMHRVIEGEMMYSDMYARMLENFPANNLDAKGEELRREMATHVVPQKVQKEIRRVFGKKIKFLCEDRDKVSLPCARVLNHLHDYRNMTQHRDQVRSESITAATLVYFDIATDFLVRLQPGSTAWIGGENYDWLKKYGIQNKMASPEEMRPRIAEGLRSGLPLDVAGIRTALATHLMDPGLMQWRTSWSTSRNLCLAISEQRQLSRWFNFGIRTQCPLIPRLSKFTHSLRLIARTLSETGAQQPTPSVRSRISWRCSTDSQPLKTSSSLLRR